MATRYSYKYPSMDIASETCFIGEMWITLASRDLAEFYKDVFNDEVYINENSMPITCDCEGKSQGRQGWPAAPSGGSRSAARQSYHASVHRKNTFKLTFSSPSRERRGSSQTVALLACALVAITVLRIFGCETWSDCFSDVSGARDDG